MLFSLLQPDLILGSNILQLTPNTLKHYQLRGLILDIDDTIISVKTSIAQPEILEWIAEIRQVAQLWLVTNNPHRRRIESIANSLDLPYFLSAAKPSRKKLRQAVNDMDLPYQEVAMVGDRIFTDVLAGNRLGIFTILVEPIASQKSTSGFHLLRQAEFSLAQLMGVSLKHSNTSHYQKS